MSQAIGKLKQLPRVTLLFGAVVILPAFLPETVRANLQFDRERILGGEVWRVFTGHLVHWTTTHLVWDLLVFSACGGMLEWIRRRLMMGVLAVSSLFVSLALLFFETDLQTYRGLSAVDMSLFAAVCLQAIAYCRLRRKTTLAALWVVALAACLLKPLLEVLLGGSLFVPGFGVGVEASPASHVYGIMACLLMAAATCFWKKLSSCLTNNRICRNRRLWGISIS